jgi:hypothetical protein
LIEEVASNSLAPILQRESFNSPASGDDMSVRIPFMITNAMREQLRIFGFTEKEIYSMPSDKAHDILMQHYQSSLPQSEDL